MTLKSKLTLKKFIQAKKLALLNYKPRTIRLLKLVKIGR